jgi:hypothetical protein
MRKKYGRNGFIKSAPGLRAATAGRTPWTAPVCRSSTCLFLRPRNPWAPHPPRLPSPLTAELTALRLPSSRPWQRRSSLVSTFTTGMCKILYCFIIPILPLISLHLIFPPFLVFSKNLFDILLLIWIRLAPPLWSDLPIYVFCINVYCFVILS